MAIFTNTRPNAIIPTIELSPVPEGNISFFYVKGDENVAGVKEWLTSALGQNITAETKTGGETVLVTHGVHSQADILNKLALQGDEFKFSRPQKFKFEPWKLRGWLSMAGQPLQLLSAYMSPDGIDGARVGFATSNMLANASNIVFGAEKHDDENQLIYLKQAINNKLSAELPEEAIKMLPKPEDDSRADLRAEPEKRKSLSARVYGLMKDNSVKIGEIGLRYIGAIALAFPLKYWKAACEAFQKGIQKGSVQDAFKGAYEAAHNKKPLQFLAGCLYLFGKTIALTAKAPDKFSDEKHSWLDEFREKYVFRLSSLIESGAAISLMAHSFWHEKVTFAKNNRFVPPDMRGKTYPDFIGGIGGAAFAAGQGIRLFAPYAIREVDLAELKAHIIDVLALMPRDKIPQLTAETVAYLHDHFSKLPVNPVEYGATYKDIADGLYRDYNIAIQTHDSSSENTANTALTAKSAGHKFADDHLRKLSTVSVPAASSHGEREKQKVPVGSMAIA